MPTNSWPLSYIIIQRNDPATRVEYATIEEAAVEARRRIDHPDLYPGDIEVWKFHVGNPLRGVEVERWRELV